MGAPELLKQQFVRTDPASFDALLEKVHDRWIALDEVRFDQNTGQVSMPLTVENIERRKVRSRFGLAIYENPELAASLVISHVKAFEVIDDAHIDAANINTIKFANGTLTIRCGIPSHCAST